MTPQTCACNIKETIDFTINSSKDRIFIRQMKELKTKISCVFDDFAQDLQKIRKIIHQFIMESELYRNSKNKIEKYLKKMK